MDIGDLKSDLLGYHTAHSHHLASAFSEVCNGDYRHLALLHHAPAVRPAHEKSFTRPAGHDPRSSNVNDPTIAPGWDRVSDALRC